VNPGQNDLLWWSDDVFHTGFVDTSGYGTYWGYDTLQIVALDGSVDPEEVIFILHPQYYHDSVTTNWEDPTNAIGVFAVTNFTVWDDSESEWVDGLVTGGTAAVPVTYVLENENGDPYFLCNLDGMYLNLRTGARTAISLEDAYLEIPAGVI
jgi:hypothetical protein